MSEIDEEEIQLRMGLVRWFLRQRFAGHRLWEEILAEGYIGMWKALAEADQHPGVCRTTLATNGALWAALDYLRSKRNNERTTSRKGGRLPTVEWLEEIRLGREDDGPDQGWEPPAPELVEEALANLECRQKVQELKKKRLLSGRDWEIIERTVMDDELLIDVAADLGLSRRELARRRKASLLRLRRYEEKREERCALATSARSPRSTA